MTQRLLREIKQTRPFSSLEEEVNIQLARTADYLDYAFVLLFRDEDLTPTQYNVLRILRGAGETGLPCREVGSRMITRVPDITRLLDRLERDKLVRRVRSKDDRRVVHAFITEKGLESLARLDEPVVELAKKLLSHMTQKELQTLDKLLEKARGPEPEPDK